MIVNKLGLGSAEQGEGDLEEDCGALVEEEVPDPEQAAGAGEEADEVQVVGERLAPAEEAEL